MSKQATRLLALVVIVMSNAAQASTATWIESLAPCGAWAQGQRHVWCMQVQGMGGDMPQVLVDGESLPARYVERTAQTLRFRLPVTVQQGAAVWLREGPRASNSVWLSRGRSQVVASSPDRQLTIADRLVTGVDLVSLLLHENVEGLAQARRIAGRHGLQIVGAIPPLNVYQVRLPSRTLLERDAWMQALGNEAAVEAVLVEDDNPEVEQRPASVAEPPDREGWQANRFAQAVDLYRDFALSAPPHSRPGRVSVGVIEKGVNFDTGDFSEFASPCSGSGVCLHAGHSQARNAHGSIVTGVLAGRVYPGGNLAFLSRLGALGGGFRVIVERGAKAGVLGRVAASANLVEDHVRVLNWSWGVHRLGSSDLAGDPVKANLRSDLAFDGYGRLLERFFAWLQRDHPDVVVVNSAGNSGATTDDHLPAALASKQLLVVGAHQRSGRDVAVEDARFVLPRGNSNIGPRVDITAAACPRPPLTTAPRSGRGGGCGTSYAAALVTATVAAMLAIDPALHPAQVRALLRRSALPANGQAPRLDMREALWLTIGGRQSNRR